MRGSKLGSDGCKVFKTKKSLMNTVPARGLKCGFTLACRSMIFLSQFRMSFLWMNLARSGESAGSMIHAIELLSLISFRFGFPTPMLNTYTP